MNKKLSKFTFSLIIVQFILTFVCIVFGVLYLLGNKGLINILEILVGVNLIIIGICNYMVYSKKKSLIIYTLLGVFMIVIGILYMLEVI